MASFFLTRVVQILNTRTPVYLSFLKKRLIKEKLGEKLALLVSVTARQTSARGL